MDILLALFPGLTWVDLLAIGAALPLWLCIGTWAVGRAPRLVRYTWGVGGGLGLALGLFVYHGLGRWIWLPCLTVAVGLGWVAATHGAMALRDAWRARRAARDPRVTAATGHPPAPEDRDACL
jgi:hypothetical protein